MLTPTGGDIDTARDEHGNAHEDKQGHAHCTRERVSRCRPREHPRPRWFQHVEGGQDQHVDESRAQQVAHGQIDPALVNGVDADEQVRQRGRGGDEKSATGK